MREIGDPEPAWQLIGRRGRRRARTARSTSPTAATGSTASPPTAPSSPSGAKTGSGVGRVPLRRRAAATTPAPAAGLAIADGSCSSPTPATTGSSGSALDGSGATVIVPTGAVKRPQGLAARSGAADRRRRRRAPAGRSSTTGGAQLTTFGTGPGQQAGPAQLPVRRRRSTRSAACSWPTTSTTASSATARRRSTPTAPAGARTARGSGSCSTRAGSPSTPNGDQFVADPGGNRIDVFDFQGAPKGFFGSSGRVTGQFIRPLGVGAGRERRARRGGLRQRPRPAAEPGRQRRSPRSARPRPARRCCRTRSPSRSTARGLLYVLDQQRSRVLVFDRGGKIIRTIGSRGRGAGQLLAPSAVAVSPRRDASTSPTPATGGSSASRTSGTHLGSIGRFRDDARRRGLRRTAAASTRPTPARNRISVLTAPAATASRPTIGAGELRSPARDRARRRRQRVGGRPRQRPRAGVLARRPAAAAASASAASGPGQFVEPTGISVACNGLVTVAEADNNRVQQFQLPATAACASLPADHAAAEPDPRHPAGPGAAGGLPRPDAHERDLRRRVSSRCGCAATCAAGSRPWSR